MSLAIKNKSHVKRTLELWIILLLPIIGALTYLIASHAGLDNVDCLKVIIAVLAASWMVVYGFTRWLRRRPHTPA